MNWSITCGDVLPGCPATFSADSKEELLAKVAEHAARDHGIDRVDDDTRAAIEAEIRTAGPA